LAVTLKANPNTIGKAYSEMEIRGLVVTQVGSGTYIAQIQAEEVESDEERLVRLTLEAFLERMSDLGVSWDRLFRLIEAEYRKKVGKNGIKHSKNT
jgi:GntR family transcriptional regulator